MDFLSLIIISYYLFENSLDSPVLVVVLASTNNLLLQLAVLLLRCFSVFRLRLFTARGVFKVVEAVLRKKLRNESTRETLLPFLSPLLWLLPVLQRNIKNPSVVVVYSQRHHKKIFASRKFAFHTEGNL